MAKVGHHLGGPLPESVQLVVGRGTSAIGDPSIVSPPSPQRPDPSPSPKNPANPPAPMVR